MRCLYELETYQFKRSNLESKNPEFISWNWVCLVSNWWQHQMKVLQSSVRLRHAPRGYGVKGNEVDQYCSESITGFMSPSDNTPSGAWNRMCGFGEHCKYGFNSSGNRVIQLHYPWTNRSSSDLPKLSTFSSYITKFWKSFFSIDNHRNLSNIFHFQLGLFYF